MTATIRKHPNIIITGTPGCGKTSHSASIVSNLGKSYTHYNISEVAKQRECFESYDDKLDTHVVDEDRLLDSLEDDLRKGGAIVDWHCCDIFPERLIDLVVVLKVDTDSLVTRLTKRGYKDNKIQENLDCEIMDVILQDAREGYQPEIVIQLISNNVEDMDTNVDRIVAWVENWVKDHPEGVTNELDEDGVKALRAVDEEFEGSDVSDEEDDVVDDAESEEEGEDESEEEGEDESEGESENSD